jgi:hypothetical protein
VAVYGKTKAEALSLLRDNLAAASYGTLADADRTTVGQWLTRWVEGKKSNLADTTYEQ